MLTAINTVSNAQFELIEKVDAVEGKVIIPYTKYRMVSNGLTLIIHEDHSDPIAHVEVAYHVGSARESVRNSGFAHFFEHMMFQGSKNVADEEHFKIISEAGGTNNAYTAFDKTVYHQSAPSNLTETMLWLEADRMGTHLDGFTQEKFEMQRDAVKNEKRQRYDNVPYGMVNEILFKTLYPNHPYEWTPIGFVDDLDDATFEDLRNFFLRWYGPNNATVVVAGDVNPEEVMAWVAKYFGSINKCPNVYPTRAQKPRLTSDIYVNTTDNIVMPRTMIAFPTVEEFNEDEAAMDILMEIIGGGNNSILYKNLVKSKKALFAAAYHQTFELSGFAGIIVQTMPEQYGGLNKYDLETIIRESISEFETRGVTDEDLQIIKNQVLRSSYSTLNSISSKAGILSHFALMKGDGYNLQDEIDRYSSVTKEDVMRVYKKYLQGNKAVFIRVEREEPKQGDDEVSKSVNPHAGEPKKIHPQYNGLTYNPPVDSFDRSIRPVIPAGKAVRVPDFYLETFENGLKLIGTRSTESPMVYFYFDMDGGHLLDANKKVDNGTAEMTAAMMGEGTKTLTTEEFSRKLDLLGSSISFNAGLSSTTIFVSCLKDNVDATLAMLEDALMNPRFDEEDFKRIKKQMMESVESSKRNASVMASKAFNQLMFKGTILEKYSSGDVKSIKKITLKDVINFYNTYYSPNVTNLVISGDITKEEALSKLDFLRKWENKNVVVPSLPAFSPLEGGTIYLVDKEYAAQSTVVLGQHFIPYDYNGDYFKASVMNYSLGGAFNSRINLNLREDKGYTYGARSFFSGNSRYGYFKFSSEIKKENTADAIRELMKEINTYYESGITADELAFTQSSMVLSEALRYETPFQKLGFLNNILEHGLPANYTAEQATLIRSMTVEDINSVIRSSLDPNRMIIIVVGHAYKVRPELEKLGYKVVDLKVD